MPINLPVTLARRLVLLVDDHGLFRAGLKLLLERHPALNLQVLEAGSIDEAVSLLRLESSIELVLLDIRLPGLSGLAGLQQIRQAHPAARVAMLSGEISPPIIDEALSRGADGFIPKSSRPEVVHAAVAALLEGRRHFPMVEGTGSAGTHTDNLRLTPRQLEVLRLLAEGLTNKVIARRLGLSENTVRVHVAATLSWFGCSTRMEAVHLARQRGIHFDV
ncbi:response regulator [Leptothrix sp. BB-4]